jgi:hypothetical protein
MPPVVACLRACLVPSALDGPLEDVAGSVGLVPRALIATRVIDSVRAEE